MAAGQEACVRRGWLRQRGCGQGEQGRGCVPERPNRPRHLIRAPGTRSTRRAAGSSDPSAPDLGALRGKLGRGGGSSTPGEKPLWRRIGRWALLGLGVWLLLSAALFVVSSQIQKGKLDDAAADRLGGFPLLVAKAQTILVMGTDARPEGSDEGGAEIGSEVPGGGRDRRGHRKHLRPALPRRHADAGPGRRRRLREALDPPRHLRRDPRTRAPRRSTPPTRSAAPPSRSRRSRSSSGSTSTTSSSSTSRASPTSSTPSAASPSTSPSGSSPRSRADRRTAG